MTPTELLREARIVLFEHGWCQDALEREDGSVCALGAINIASNGIAALACRRNPATSGAWEALREAAGASIATFNNTPGRTFDEIVEWFDRAEKIAERDEQGMG